MNLVTVLLLTLAFPIASQANPHTLKQPETSIHTIAAQKHVLLLYYTSYCPYSQKVLSYLNKIHKTLPMRNLGNVPKAKEELKEIGGKMQVPCLIIDGHPLYESDAIIDWLSKHQSELEQN